jgi:hypothetical protein
VKDATGAEVETTTYSTTYVEQNSVAKLNTTGRYQVSLSSFFRSTKMTGVIDLLLTFNGTKCTVSAPAGSSYTISGTGDFLPKKYIWGEKQRDGITLNYKVSSTTFSYEATETLVARDRAVVMETYTPAIF